MSGSGNKSALEVLERASTFLKEQLVPDADNDAIALLTEGLGIDRVSLYRDNPALTVAQLKRLDEALSRRANREPLQYILGTVDFFGLKIHVGPGVLIPRPETELLVETSLAELKGISSPAVLDLCTGSGCIALAIADNVPNAEVIGTDDSDIAISYAQRNADENIIHNVRLIKGSLFEPIKGMKLDAIISNPPYIKSGDIDGLAPEIRDWEPRGALDGGPDGLDFYRLILKEAADYLKEDGFIALEIGAGQAEDISRIAESSGLKPIKTIKDYAGIDRVMVFQKQKYADCGG